MSEVLRNPTGSFGDPAWDTAEDESLYGTRTVFVDVDKDFSIHVRPELPPVETPIFRVYNKAFYLRAEKTACFRFDCAETVAPANTLRTEWVMGTEELRAVAEALQAPSQHDENCTVWQEAKWGWNRENLERNLGFRIYLSGGYDGTIDDPRYLPASLPMPDYTKTQKHQ